MKSRIDWRQVKPATALREAVHAGLALACIALGWLSFPLLLLLVVVELALVVALTAIFHPARRQGGRALRDTLKMIGISAFLSIFMLAVYVGAGGKLLDVKASDFLVLAALAALQIGWLAVLAWRSPEPRQTWGRAALVQGAGTVMAMFLGAFTGFVVGLPLAMLLALAWPAQAADLGLAIAMLGGQLVIACIFSTMSEDELREIADQPYLDAPDAGKDLPRRIASGRRARPATAGAAPAAGRKPSSRAPAPRR